MADQRKGGISWTDETWNPLRGCSPSMPCAPHCWARRMAIRQKLMPGYQDFVDTKGRWTGRVKLIESQLDAPLHWRKPRRIAVGLMGDLFRLPFEEIDRIYQVMHKCRQHTFQTLTKVPEIRREYFKWRRFAPMPHVHEGLSCMTQADVDRDLPILLQTPAALRWLSLEPLLGPVDIREHLAGKCGYYCHEDVGHVDHTNFDWVVVGGETGPGAQRCDLGWIRAIVRQCREAGVPCFVKQVGAYPTCRNDNGFEGDTPESWPMDTRYTELDSGYQGAPVRVRLKDRKGADPSEWPEDLRVRQMPEMPHA